MQCAVEEIKNQPADTGSPGQLTMPCSVCGAPAIFICDFEVSPGRTCDAPLCGRCRINIGLKDYCPAHAGLSRKEEKSDGTR